jgi:hypothetical protein
MAQLPVRSNWRGRDKSRRVTIKQRSDEALGAMRFFFYPQGRILGGR